MRDQLRKEIKNASTIEEVLKITLNLISQIKKENPDTKIGYVSGKVTTDGEENISKNLKRLHVFTEKISKEFGENIFSAADVFDEEVYWKINLPRPVHEEDFYAFWRKIVEGGITDIFMTPEWEKSIGATDEYKTAKKIGIKIHDLS
jgi:hypothetical protein